MARHEDSWKSTPALWASGKQPHLAAPLSMRLTLLSTGVHPGIRGGMQRHTYFLALHLARLGTRIALVHPAHQEIDFPQPEREHIEGIPVAWSPLPGPYHYVLEYYLYSRRAAKQIRQGASSDAIYGQGYTLWAYLATQTQPTIFSPHGLEQFQPLLTYDRIALYPWRAIARYHVKHCSKVVSLGGNLSTYLMRDCGATADQLSVIPNGVSLEHVDAYITGAERHRRSIVFAGRLVRHKGLDLLVESLGSIRRRDFQIEVVGDGPLRRWLQRVRDPRLRWLGWQEDAQLFPTLASAWGLVFAGRGEGMPTVILEAMAAGVPVVATDIGAVRDLVTPETGFLVPPADPGALAEGLRCLLALGEDERARMGAAARAHVEARFTWDHVAHGTLELLEEIARRAERGRVH